MTHTRRAFLHDSSVAALAASVHLSLPRFVTQYLDLQTGTPEPALKELAAAALDAAKAAGASYADVRFSLIQHRRIGVISLGTVRRPYAISDVAASVRVLVDGYWGFVSGITWSTDDVVRLARSAVAQAKAVDWGIGKAIELAPAPAVTGQWTTPIERDPLEVPLEEIIATLTDVHRVGLKAGGEAISEISSTVGAMRADKTFASTEGSFLQQRLYTMFSDYSGSVVVAQTADASSRSYAGATGVWPTSGGYELLAGVHLKEQMPEMVQRAIRGLNAQPGDVGRYDIVLDARSTASLIAMTVGRATQLDRALGNEANSTGTSFLAPPASVLGTMHLGTPAITISADRSTPRGAATVKWDDEGVAPDSATLIDHGLVTDYQTGREQAVELREYYTKHGRAVRSHGYGTADSAHHVPLPQTPNLALQPGAGGDVDALIQGVADGYAFFNMSVDVDQQAINGQSSYAEAVYRIRKGKLAEATDGMSLLFGTPEIWRGVEALGGPKSAITMGTYDYKGEPYQDVMFSVTAVPMRVRNMRVADLARKL